MLHTALAEWKSMKGIEKKFAYLSCIKEKHKEASLLVQFAKEFCRVFFIIEFIFVSVLTLISFFLFLFNHSFFQFIPILILSPLLLLLLLLINIVTFVIITTVVIIIINTI